MLKSLRHKRFRILNESSSLLSCIRCMQVQGNIVPTGNEYNDIYKRSDHIHT